MSSESPDIVIYDVNGNPLAIQNNTVLPASISGLIVAGSDGTDARFLAVNSSGQQIIVGSGTAGTASSGVMTVQGIASMTPVQVSQATAANLNATVTGTVTANQGTANTLANAWAAKLTDATNGPVAVKPASTAAVATDPALVVAISPNNSITASNPSVTTTGSAPPTSATYIGGSVTTSSPSYTTGQMSGLSLTTAGALRIDGSAVTQPVSIASSVTVAQATAANLNATVTGTIAATQSGTWTVQPGNTANTTPWLATINQGSNSAVVAAASTAVAAANPALAVGLSPNSPLPSGTNNIGALANMSISGNAVPSYSAQIGGSSSGGAMVPVNIAIGSAATSSQAGLVVALHPSSPLPSGSNTIGQIVGTAANGSVISGNPVLMAGYDGTDVRILGSVVDRSAMTAGSQNAQPIMGQSYGVGRIARTNRLGNLTPGYQTLLALDVVEGSTINSWLWTQSVSTMTIAQTSGVIVLNNNNTQITTTYAILTSNRQFSIFNQSPIGCSFKAQANQAGVNEINEIGFGAPTTTTAIINDGAFFRIKTTGEIFAVTSYNGTETISAQLGSISNTSYYLWVVILEDDGAHFIIEDNNGVPLVDYFANLPLTTAEDSSVTHIPAFARVYTNGAAGSAPKWHITSFQAWQYDINTSKPWSEQLAGGGRELNISPTAFTQEANCAVAAPTGHTLSTTAYAYTTLGGEYQLTVPGTATTSQVGIFAFTVPAPYTLVITDVIIPSPVITTTIGATALNIEFIVGYATTGSSPATQTNGFSKPYASFAAAASAATGTAMSGQAIAASLKSPIVVLPGQFLLVTMRMWTAPTTGAISGTVTFAGYFE